jgi:hypothetical protein
VAEHVDELVGEENRGALIRKLATKVLDVENQESLSSDLSETLKKNDDEASRPKRSALTRKLAMEFLDAENQKSLVRPLRNIEEK